jgi:uncharacterized protein
MNNTATAGEYPPHRPWYREPLLWLVIAIPALTVVAGLSTVLIAFHGADDPVADEIRKEGLAIHHDPTRDRAAVAAGVEATLALGDGQVHVTVVAGHATLPRSLVLLLSHATRAERDQMLTLDATGSGQYAGTLPPLAGGHWYLELTPTDRSWRLTGEFAGERATLQLRPRTTL